MREAAALIGTRADWWFQGRELVEALAVLAALAAGDAAGAERRFHDALALAERRLQMYGAAWLVAECATPLGRAGITTHWSTVEHYATVADTLGYVLLTMRYSTVLAQRAASDEVVPSLAGAVGLT